uniref:calcitonin receptor n=1 Tax=Myodes glareolus TaxID=447135 RepID=UPI002021521C|nr:calcitonin receptor [Myodes glareolus]
MGVSVIAEGTRVHKRSNDGAVLKRTLENTAPFEVEKAKLGEAVADVAAAGAPNREGPGGAGSAIVRPPSSASEEEGGGDAHRKGLKSEKFAHSLISGRAEAGSAKCPPKVGAIRAPSTREETGGAQLPHIGFENGSKEIQSIFADAQENEFFLTVPLQYSPVPTGDTYYSSQLMVLDFLECLRRGNHRKPKLRFHLVNRFTLLLLLLLSPTPVVQAPANLSEPSPTNEAFLYAIGRKKLLEAQYSCYDRIQELPPYEGEGPYCNRTWDGWLCWDDTPAGVTAYQHCPDYFPDFDVTEKVSKYCDENGEWFRHPDSNRTWSNYTLCNAFTSEKLHNAYVLYYLALVGHSLSIAALVASLGIYLVFKSLRCQRVTVHKNMFLTYILNSIIIIIHLVEVVPNGDLVRRDPMHIFHHSTHMWTMQWELSPLLPPSAQEGNMDSNDSEVISCKVLHFFHQYMMACNYFWMLCEGIYLHTLIVVAVFAEEQRLRWYYLLGWGFPVIPTTIHAVTRALYYNDNCWLSVETHLLYIVHGPVMVALVVNFFFLLNIVRVLVTKLRQTHQAETYMYLKAVKATMVLVPLLGIQFVVFPWRPSNKILGKIYDYVMHSLVHFQGFFVATIYCFCNHEVQVAVKRQWAKFKIQWSQRWGRRRRRTTNRVVAAPRVTAFAEPGGLPIYICHQEPRNPPVNNNQVEEVTEMIPLNVIQQDPSAVEQDSSA